MIYGLLSLAIVCEVAATLLLKASDGWTRLWFGAASVSLYCVAGILLGLVLKQMSVGLAYAIWAGAGIALVCVASTFFWAQRFDASAVIGIALIVAGVMLITLKSKVVIQ